MTVKSGHFSTFKNGFRKILLRSGAELSWQAENERVKQLHFTGWISFTGPLYTFIN